MPRGWQAIRQRLGPAEGWVKRRWAAMAAAAAVLATTLGVIADVGSLIPGGGLSGAQAEALAGEVALQLEAGSVARGGEYGSRDAVEEAALDLARTGDRRIADGLRTLRNSDGEAGLDPLAEAVARRSRRHPEEASSLHADLGLLAETIAPQRAAEFYETAVAAEPADPDAIDGLAGLRLRMGQTDAAEALWQEARRRAATAGADRDLAAAEAGLGLVAVTRADFDSAEAHYGAALDIYDLEGDLRASARQLGNLGHAAQGRGDADAAERYYTRALALMEEDGDALGIALARNNLAGFHRDRGDFGAAEDAYRLSLASLESIGDRPRTALVISNLGFLAETQGDTARAARLYDRALERARTYRYVRVIDSTARRAGWLALEAGELDAARTYADEALDVHETLGDPQARADALILSSTIAQAGGDAVRAETEAREALSLAELWSGTEESQAYLHAILAASRRSQGNGDDAVTHTLRSRDLYAEAGNDVAVADQVNRLATLMFDRGEVPAGCDFLRAARAIYERVDTPEGAASMTGRLEANGCEA